MTDAQRFQPGSVSHLVVLCLLVLLILSLCLHGRNQEVSGSKRRLHVFLGLWLLFLELSRQAYYLLTNAWSVRYALPLHLCDLALLLMAVMLLFEKRVLFDVVYYLSLGATPWALFTPDTLYDFPHPSFIQFFLTHGSVVVICFYLLLVETWRPSRRGFLRSVLLVNLYALVIFPLNFLLKSNYLFLRQKPVLPTLLDVLGPWPWYIVSLEAIVLAVFGLLWLACSFRQPGGNGRQRKEKKL